MYVPAYVLLRDANSLRAPTPRRLFLSKRLGACPVAPGDSREEAARQSHAVLQLSCVTVQRDFENRHVWTCHRPVSPCLGEDGSTQSAVLVCCLQGAVVLQFHATPRVFRLACGSSEGVSCGWGGRLGIAMVSLMS